MVLSFHLLVVVLALDVSYAFLSHAPQQQRLKPLHMVRNIDLPEALVFFGKHVYQHDDGNLLPGVKELVEEAKEIETPVVVLLINEEDNVIDTDDVTVIPASGCLPPNPRALYEAVNSLQIQPKGFGGSSGFGSRKADPVRSPIFQHVVVFCDSLDVCRAARYVGARVVCLTDNDLADAIVDEWSELCIDDVATPGSYWLNPPHPKDDEGNRVDIDDIIYFYESDGRQHEDATQETPPPPMHDEEMARILADLDSI